LYREQQSSLHAAVTDLRRTLPPGAPVLALPSVRARDYAEVVRGVALPLGLASSLFHAQSHGDFALLRNLWVLVIDGVLRGAHAATMLAHYEAVVRAGASLLIACQDLDPEALALLLVNKEKGTMHSIALSPQPGAGRPALEALASIAGARVGSADATRVDVGTRGAIAGGVLATLDAAVALGEFTSPASTSVGLVHVGGRDLDEARARARSLPPG
jgi:hypothetical protein